MRSVNLNKNWKQTNKQLYLSLLCLILFTSCINPGSRRGELISSFKQTNRRFTIKAAAYREKRAILNGTFYVFSTMDQSSTNEREFMALHHDDQPEIPRDSIRFLNNETAYVFMLWMYAVTKDSGQTWFVWDATKNVTDWSWGKYGWIKDVQISPEGIGEMIISAGDKRSKMEFKFRTSDFGYHWQAE